MQTIQNESEIFRLFREFSSIRLHKYIEEENAFVFMLETQGGGEREDETFYLKFSEVSIFHFPVNFEHFYIKKSFISSVPVNELRKVDISECKTLLPNSSQIESALLIDNTKCYRFFAYDNIPTDCYIVCEKMEAWIKS